VLHSLVYSLNYRLYLLHPHFLHHILFLRVAFIGVYFEQVARSCIVGRINKIWCVCVCVCVQNRTATGKRHWFHSQKERTMSERTYLPVSSCVYQLRKHSSSDNHVAPEMVHVAFLIAAIKISPTRQLSYKTICFIRATRQ
jgi:hypothetical protein